MYYLSVYNPLCATEKGLQAIKEFSLLPYVEGSSRREPDFESPYPSITALGRNKNFAPYLKVGDKIVYLTKKGQYQDSPVSHWRFVSVLEVFRRFDSHEEAARWYKAQGLSIPANCVVDGNPPVDLSFTFETEELPPPNINRFHKRNRDLGIFIVCTPLYLELDLPLFLLDKDVKNIFGRIPKSQAAVEITPEQLHIMEKKAGLLETLTS